MNDLDQFLTASDKRERGSFGEPTTADYPADRLAVYSTFEADLRVESAQPDASPLVRWMLTDGGATAAEHAGRPSPFVRAGCR